MFKENRFIFLQKGPGDRFLEEGDSLGRGKNQDFRREMDVLRGAQEVAGVRNGIAGAVAETGKVGAEEVDPATKLNEMAAKFADAKPVLEKLQLLKDQGKIAPDQHSKFTEILSKLRPECWKGVKFISFIKLPLINAFTFRVSDSSARRITLNDEMSTISFTHEITHNIWEKVLTAEQKASVAEIHGAMSKKERMDTHWKKHPKMSYLIQGGSAEEWFCQAFACWQLKIEPYHANIIRDEKLKPVVQLFESFRA